MCTLNRESEFHLGLDESVEDMKGSFRVFSLKLLERTGKAVVFSLQMVESLFSLQMVESLFPLQMLESFSPTDGGESFPPTDSG